MRMLLKFKRSLSLYAFSTSIICTKKQRHVFFPAFNIPLVFFLDSFFTFTLMVGHLLETHGKLFGIFSFILRSRQAVQLNQPSFSRSMLLFFTIQKKSIRYIQLVKEVPCEKFRNKIFLRSYLCHKYTRKLIQFCIFFVEGSRCPFRV